MIDVVDFFSGCGGTSVGLQQAGLNIAMGIDIDPDASSTYRSNFPLARFIEGDIRQLSVEALAPLFAEKKRPFLFCGCAPCQPFSKQNRSTKEIDPRRTLLTEFERFVSRWQPEYVLVENVPGLQKISDATGPLAGFVEELRRLGYAATIGILPALWFGVPQRRDRLILLASRLGPITLPSATHGDGKSPFSTVRDWIGDLPKISAGQTDDNDPDHRAASLSALNMRRIRATPEGGGRESWPQNIWLDCHKDHDGHSDVYGRLAWDKPAAGLTTRCISYSNGRFGHPSQDRAISLREAACIQTFPKNYAFVGSHASRAKQVGNAVPPLMAQALGAAILSHAMGCPDS